MEEQIDRGRWTDRDTERGRDGGGERQRYRKRDRQRYSETKRRGEFSIRADQCAQHEAPENIP